MGTAFEELRIRVKVLATGELPYIPFMAALDKWLNHGGVEIARDADIKEYESDEELLQAQRIVKGVWNLMAENPRTEYAINKEKLDALEEATLKDLIELNLSRFEKHFLLSYLEGRYPAHDRDTLRRRIDSIVEKKRLDRIKEGTTTFYALKAEERLRREVVV